MIVKNISLTNVFSIYSDKKYYYFSIIKMLQNLTRRVFTLRHDSPNQTRDDVNETDIDTIRQS